MKKYLIINECFSNNFGDQAINKNLINLFKENKILTHSVYLSNLKINELPKISYQKIKKSNTNKVIGYLKSFLYFLFWYYRNYEPLNNILKKNQYEKIIIGGGQLIGSSNKIFPNTFSIALFWISRIAAKVSNAKIVYFGVGVNSKHGFIEKLLYSYALKKSSLIIVRDLFSKNILIKNFNVKSKVAPDVAFYNSLSHHTEDKHRNFGLVFITDFKILVKNKKVFSDLNSYYEFCFLKVKEYKKRGLEVLLSYTTLEDSCQCLDFKKYIKDNYNENLELTNIQSLNDLIFYLKKSKIIHSGRMHALILGKKWGADIDPFLLSEKVEEFSKEYLSSNIEYLNIKLKEAVSEIILN